jgi:diphthine-ammonia ligase
MVLRRRILYLASWSGGKDSCFAVYKAKQRGMKVAGLMNCVSHENGRVSFHGVDARLIQAQASLLGIPLLQKETTPDRYADEFKEGVRTLAEGNDITGMVFGDIYLDEHLAWVEGVCRDIGISAIEPLWGQDTSVLIKAFVAAGFRSVIIAGNVDCIDREWIGKTVDDTFIEYLNKRPDVDPCGERGEYHTLVVGGPLFNGSIEITGGEIIERNGYRFFDVNGFHMIENAQGRSGKGGEIIRSKYGACIERTA